MAKQSEETSKPKRWGAKKKAEVVLRLFRGESIEDVSRSIGVPHHRLNEWREEALSNLEEGFKKRVNDPKEVLLSRAKEQIGKLSMENELLRKQVEKKGPLVWRRSKK